MNENKDNVNKNTCAPGCDCDCSRCGVGSCCDTARCPKTGWSLKRGLYYIGTLVGIVLFVYLIALAVNQFKAAKYIGSGIMPQTSISVNGKGEIPTKPDIATFTYSINEKAKTVEAAQDAASAKANKVLEALKTAGVSEADLKQTNYNINPEYDYVQTPCYQTAIYPPVPCSNGKSVLKGYEVTQSVEVKVRDLAKAGSLFQTVGTLGVSNVYGLVFSIDKIDEVKEQARLMAVADAKQSAEKLAKQLGVTLVRITSFYDQCSYGCYGDMYYGRESVAPMAAGSANSKVEAPSIPAGEQKIQSNVTITYEIK